MSGSANERLKTRPSGLPRPGTLLTVLCGVLALVACGPSDGRDLSDLIRADGILLDPETMEPYSGLAFVTFEGRTGSPAHRLKLWKGVYHGPFESDFHGRDVSARESFLDGVRHGPFEWYFESGKLFEEGTYQNGRREGTYRAYWESGDLYEEGTYLDGDFDGPRRWYSNGRLIELVTYRRGVIDGLYERYREDGTLDLKGMLQDGEPCGVWFEDEHTIAYTPCGMLVTE